MIPPNEEAMFYKNLEAHRKHEQRDGIGGVHARGRDPSRPKRRCTAVWANLEEKKRWAKRIVAIES